MINLTQRIKDITIEKVDDDLRQLLSYQLRHYKINPDVRHPVSNSLIQLVRHPIWYAIWVQLKDHNNESNDLYNR